jgi:peptidyl-tRNA hydrolase
MNKPRMVIVTNMAANMGIGRLAAQIAHAATQIIIEAGKWTDEHFQLSTCDDSDLRYWMKESFTKIVVKVWGEEALQQLQEDADKAGLRTALMVEEDGQITTLAIGPSSSPELDRLTRHLSLL